MSTRGRGDGTAKSFIDDLTIRLEEHQTSASILTSQSWLVLIMVGLVWVVNCTNDYQPY